MKRKKASHFSHKIITTETVNCQLVLEGNSVPSKTSAGVKLALLISEYRIIILLCIIDFTALQSLGP